MDINFQQVHNFRQLDDYHQKLGGKQTSFANRTSLIIFKTYTGLYVPFTTLKETNAFQDEIYSHPDYAPDLARMEFYMFRCFDSKWSTDGIVEISCVTTVLEHHYFNFCHLYIIHYQDIRHYI